MDTAGNEFKRVVGKIWYTLTSRKFLAAAGATFAVLSNEVPLDPATQATALAGIWIAFIFGTALEDGLRG